MAFGIKANGYFLDLSDNSQLSFEINTELWVTGDPTVSTGSYSFPFKIPLTPTNQYVLRNPHRVDAYTRLSVIDDVVVYMGEGMSVGLPVFVGRLFIKSASSSDMEASCFVVVEGLGRKKELKFSDVDMGVFNLSVPVSLKAVMDYTVDNPLEQPFVFFPVRNKSIYYSISGIDPVEDIENYAYYNEVMNDFDTSQNNWSWHYFTNPKFVGNMMITPFLRLEYILTKVGEELGYTIVDEWLITDELKSICLFNNKSISDLEARYKNIIRYNEHLPTQMTLVEFLKQVCKWMYIGVFVNHFSKTITLRPYKHVLSQAARHNWTDRMTDDDLLEQDNSVPDSIVYAKDDTDQYFTKDYVSDLVLFQDGAIVTDYFEPGGDWNTHGLAPGYYYVKRNGAMYRYDTSKTNPFEKWKKQQHVFRGVVVGGEGPQLQVKVIPLFDDDTYGGLSNTNTVTIPRADIPMTIQIKDEDQYHDFKNDLTSIRFTIYRGRRAFPGRTHPIPYANNSAYDPATETESFDLSLQMDGDKGIYNVYGKEWMTFMNEKKIVTIKLKLTIQDILNHKEYDKIRIGNMDYLVKSLKVNVTAFGLGLTEATLVSVPFTAKM